MCKRVGLWIYKLIMSSFYSLEKNGTALNAIKTIVLIYFCWTLSRRVPPVYERSSVLLYKHESVDIMKIRICSLISNESYLQKDKRIRISIWKLRASRVPVPPFCGKILVDYIENHWSMTGAGPQFSSQWARKFLESADANNYIS